MFNIKKLKTLHCYIYIFNIYVYYINEFWDFLVWVRIKAGPRIKRRDLKLTPMAFIANSALSTQRLNGVGV